MVMICLKRLTLSDKASLMPGILSVFCWVPRIELAKKLFNGPVCGSVMLASPRIRRSWARAAMAIDQEAIVESWRKGIHADIANQPTDPAEQCLFGTVTSMFDTVAINPKKWVQKGTKVVSQDKTVLDNEGKKRIKHPL